MQVEVTQRDLNLEATQAPTMQILDQGEQEENGNQPRKSNSYFSEDQKESTYLLQMSTQIRRHCSESVSEGVLVAVLWTKKALRMKQGL